MWICLPAWTPRTRSGRRGDARILADLGLPADELEVLAVQTDLYPDEQLAAIAGRCGFAHHFAEVLKDR